MPPQTRGPSRPDRLPPWASWSLGSLAVGIILALGIRLLPDIAADSDFALIDTYVLNTVRDHQPVGVYSRFGWFHPGPLYFQILAPLYVLTGFRHLANITTVALLNVVSLAALLGIVKRHNPQMAVVALAVFGVYVTRLDGLVASTWNPHVPLLPSALLLVCSAAIIAGRTGLLPLAAGLASLVVQTHVGFAAVALVAMLLATGGTCFMFLRADQDPTRARDTRRALLVSGIVALVCWMVPLLDEASPRGRHNLRAILVSAESMSPHDPRRAGHAFEHLFLAPFTPGLQLWDTPLPRTPQSIRTAVQVQAALLFASVLVFWHRRRRFESSLSLTVIAAGLIGLAVMRRLPEEPRDYTVLWVTIIGCLSWTLIFTAAAALFQGAFTKQSRFLTSFSRSQTAVIGLLFLAFAGSQVFRQYEHVSQSSPRIYLLTQLIQNHLGRLGERSVHVRVPAAFWGIATAVVLQLDRTGTHVSVDAERVLMFGTRFTPTADNGPTIQFAQLEEHLEDLRYRSDYEQLGRATDIFIYAVSPGPSLRPLTAGLEVTVHSALVENLARLTDHEATVVGTEAQSEGVVQFFDDDQFIAIRMPSGVLGIRFWGEGASAWQVRCKTTGPDFFRLGRITIADGGGVQQGDAYLREVSHCRELKIATRGRKSFPLVERDSASWSVASRSLGGHTSIVSLPSPRTARIAAPESRRRRL